MKTPLRWMIRRGRRPVFRIEIPVHSAFFLLGTSLIGVAAIDAGVNLLLIVFGVCFGAVLLSMFVGWRALSGVTVSRAAPDAIAADQRFELRYVVKNERRWGAVRSLQIVDIADNDSPLAALEAFVPILRPGQSTIVAVPTIASRRGRARFMRIKLATQFPFGIIVKVLLVEQPHELVVFPRLGRVLGEIETTSRTFDSAGGGLTPTRVRGDEEYYGVREYRYGDNLKRIHWRRSAQMGRLMIREMSKTRDRIVWCVLDAHIDASDPVQASRLETAIGALATVVCDALERGTKVGLICNGGPLVVLPPTGGRPHRPRLLRELALQDASVAQPLAPQLERMVWPLRWHGPCLFFAALNNDEARTTARALTRCIGPTTLLVPGHKSFETLYCPPAPVSIRGFGAIARAS